MAESVRTYDVMVTKEIVYVRDAETFPLEQFCETVLYHYQNSVLQREALESEYQLVKMTPADFNSKYPDPSNVYLARGNSRCLIPAILFGVYKE